MYEVNFFTDDKQAEFWQMIGGLLRYISPFVAVAVAIILAGWLISLAIKTFRKAIGRDNDEGYQREADKSGNREEYKQKYKY